jgi:hypothetical protein
MIPMRGLPLSREVSENRTERRLGARLLRALRMVGNPGQGHADSGEVIFLCIADARRELPLK